MEKIYGSELSSLKGKTVHQCPAPVVNDVTEIPRELIASLSNVDLCIVTMFFCDLSGILDHSLKPIKLEHVTVFRIENCLNKFTRAI